MEPRICVLSMLEARELIESAKQPDCSKHRHVKCSEAREMTGDSESKLYFRPVARWVDSRRIQKLEEVQRWSEHSRENATPIRMSGFFLMRRLPMPRRDKHCATGDEGTQKTIGTKS